MRWFRELETSKRRLVWVMFFVALLFGAFEDVYGRVRYAGDAISYLNVVRAIHAGDWRLALNSLWSLGYPLILSVVLPLFPATPTGEWIGIHVVNLAIFALTFYCFFSLAWTVGQSHQLAIPLKRPDFDLLLLVGTFAIFLSIELSMDNVSRVGPDMLVSCLVFAAAGFLMQLWENPSPGRAAKLGVILGVGFVVKAVFLPLTLIFVAAEGIALWKKKSGHLCVGLTLACFAVFFLPYVSGLSWASGRLTFGEAGSLNYAWHVNNLHHAVLWEGGPPEFGTPIHPPRMVMERPPVYLFNGPFPVTFPPFFNPPYYYEGYRHIFSWKRQARSIAGNGLRFAKCLDTQFVLFVLFLLWILRKGAGTGARQVLQNALRLWPLLLIASGGIAIYLLVWVEPRYVASFVALWLLVLLYLVLAEVPHESLAQPHLRSDTALLWMLLAACCGTLIANQHDQDRDVLGHARRGEFFYNYDQWKAGIYLQKIGLRRGDKVAVMADVLIATRSTWAYIDHMEIVGLLDGAPDEFWQSNPGDQQRILAHFQSAGASLVFAMHKPEGVEGKGWEPIPETDFWFYRCQQSRVDH